MEHTIGQRIRERRKELKITQTKIQQETSISSGNLSSIENGKYLPSAVALIELSKILDCSIDWILTGESPKSENQIYNNDDLVLLNYFHNMSNDDKKEILVIAEMKYRKQIKRDEEMSSTSEDEKLA